MCVRHLHQNFKASGLQGLKMKNILWAAARATTVPWWKEEMEKMKNLHEKAWEWLNDRPANNWGRFCFNTHFKCNVLLNNLCESFNSAILVARNRPILGLLDNINMYIMLRMANKRAAGRNWKHLVGPRIFKIIEKSKVENTYCIPKMAGDKEYLVQHISGRQFVVKLKESTCSCRRWDLSGIPCSHAIACIFARDEIVYTYVHDCYEKEAYLNSYDPMIHPIPRMDLWDMTDLTPLKPPICKKQPGRPKRKRIMSVGEVKPQAHYLPPPTNLLGEHNDTLQPQRLRKWFVEIACGKCRKLGHNKVGCGKSQHTDATNKNQETQQVNTQATTQNAQANSQTSGTQMSQGNTETRALINSQGKKKQHVSSQVGQQGKGKQPVRRGGYKGMGNQARP
ncbi:uncharacterized protein LOC108867121 [Pyrus x bretschneideri]|uniref:uncharacterized protein LOC108867121 n=1 Tax=Pyrus x bretschneideri TaxID=225117 RepID=UPI0020304087|nr:uncharacterized protein LOC108867121 [Pyrus x bretschneideri]